MIASAALTEICCEIMASTRALKMSESGSKVHEPTRSMAARITGSISLKYAIAVATTLENDVCIAIVTLSLICTTYYPVLISIRGSRTFVYVPSHIFSSEVVNDLKGEQVWPSNMSTCPQS